MRTAQELRRELEIAEDAAALHSCATVAIGELARRDQRLTALSRIIRRTLACGQLEKLEDARSYLNDEPGSEWLNCPRGCCSDEHGYPLAIESGGTPRRLVPGQRCPGCREVALP